MLCSGHGECSCGVCQCDRGWIGVACNCRTSNDTCIRKKGEICSSHGTCECGACRCEVSTEGRYSGRFCEKCPTCSGRCHELKDCVQCQMYRTGPLAAQLLCIQNCTKFVPEADNIIGVDEENDEHLCTFYDEDDCRFQFIYQENYKSELLKVRAHTERQCPPKVTTHHFLFGLVFFASIIFIVIVTLFIWRFCKKQN